jgi:hypothetical protein
MDDMVVISRTVYYRDNKREESKIKLPEGAMFLCEIPLCMIDEDVVVSKELFLVHKDAIIDIPVKFIHKDRTGKVIRVKEDVLHFKAKELADDTLEKII